MGIAAGSFLTRSLLSIFSIRAMKFLIYRSLTTNQNFGMEKALSIEADERAIVAHVD